jgi:hypothetical protein
MSNTPPTNPSQNTNNNLQPNNSQSSSIRTPDPPFIATYLGTDEHKNKRSRVEGGTLQPTADTLSLISRGIPSGWQDVASPLPVADISPGPEVVRQISFLSTAPPDIHVANFSPSPQAGGHDIHTSPPISKSPSNLPLNIPLGESRTGSEYSPERRRGQDC